MVKVLIKDDLKADIYSLIKSNKKEVVLLLDGVRRQNEVEVYAIVPMKNTARSAFAFIVEEEDFIRAEEQIRHGIVGLFHSHKSSTKLSESDVSQLKKTDYPWVVGSVCGEELVLSGYCLDRGEIEGVEVS